MRTRLTDGVTVVRLTAAAIVMGVFLHLGLRSSPYLTEVPYLPSWLGRWADAHGVIRHMPAYAIFALVVIGLAGWPRRWVAVGTATGIATLIELMQLRIPGRSFGWDDVAAAFAGLGIGLAAARGIVALRRMKKQPAAALEDHNRTDGP